MAYLETVPHEILERIAYLVATERVIGPPSSLISLLCTNRQIHSQLSLTNNQYLYARIYQAKFDFGRLASKLSPNVLAHELVHRCRILTRIRAQTDSTVRPRSTEPGDTVYELLFHAYLMMLENAGNNERQLRDYANIGNWLRNYLFDEHLPLLRGTNRVENWPLQNEHTSLAMWLFWFLLRPDDYTGDDDLTWNVLNFLKVYALGAHKYQLTDPSWVKFLPEPPERTTPVMHYSEPHQFCTPPLATPAILAFLTLVNLKTKQIDFSSHIDLPMKSESNEWEHELGRCLSLSRPDFGNTLTECFQSGSVEGTWEGIFTYTEFTAYAALLQGAPPPILQKSVIVRHRQTWKLREHHFVDRFEGDTRQPLSAGDPLRAYLPNGTRLLEKPDCLLVQDPLTKKELRYTRPVLGEADEEEDEKPQMVVRDVIITGEGHSAWGQFNLIGRVRPCDGFISLCKEYIEPDRGKWIYRGYLVGNVNSNLAGRWRDTLSPAAVPGYEGCFLMTRRR
ncbi:hypothetical protein MIND_00967300 [Mycena indigotica]|uniref:F-box domain-containing protein n=1 Tax=Mycena indigotica TaxID=2126181 RepID=A0A8H6W2V4_9AGAR|nr:uncharacterized protein MIND_00967300 [Mycena indigotica]KAF7297339.1 hypothetical protein MIND_00967300 [Mycena indigotica]